MLPRFSNSQSPQVSSGDLHKICEDSFLSVLQQWIDTTRKENLIHGHFGTGRGFSVFGFNRNKPAMSYTIIVVSLWATRIKMVRIAAKVLSALMTDVFSFWNRTIVQPVSYSMGRCGSVLHQTKADIRIGLSLGRSLIPKPALSNIIGLFHSLPKPGRGRGEVFLSGNVGHFLNVLTLHGIAIQQRTGVVNVG